MSNSETQGQYKYRAFISYRHADKAWGDWLHRALELYKVPKELVGEPGVDGPIPARIYPIFRDREELAAASDLGADIRQALQDSASLIVICSPRAAASRFVDEEIRYFKSLGREHRIFALIIDGEPFANDPADECFPSALRYRLLRDGSVSAERAEPIAADARPAGDGRQNAKLKIIAALLGVGYDRLKRRDEAERTRRTRKVFIAALVLLGIFGVLAWQVLQQQRIAELEALARIDAEKQAQRSSELRSIAEARSGISSGRWDDALADLVAGYANGQRGDVETSLRYILSWADNPASQIDKSPKSRLIRFEANDMLVASSGVIINLTALAPSRLVRFDSSDVIAVVTRNELITIDGQSGAILARAGGGTPDGARIEWTLPSIVAASGSVLMFGKRVSLELYSDEWFFAFFSADGRTVEVRSLTPRATSVAASDDPEENHFAEGLPFEGLRNQLAVGRDCAIIGILKPEGTERYDPSAMSPASYSYFALDAAALIPVEAPENTAELDWFAQILTIDEVTEYACRQLGSDTQAASFDSFFDTVSLATAPDRPPASAVSATTRKEADTPECNEQSPCWVRKVVGEEQASEAVKYESLDAYLGTTPKWNVWLENQPGDATIISRTVEVGSVRVSETESFWCRVQSTATHCLLIVMPGGIDDFRQRQSPDGRFIVGFGNGLSTQDPGMFIIDLESLALWRPGQPGNLAFAQAATFALDSRHLLVAPAEGGLLDFTFNNEAGSWTQTSSTALAVVERQSGSFIYTRLSDKRDYVGGTVDLQRFKDGSIFIVRDDGVVARANPDTGEEIWRTRYLRPGKLFASAVSPTGGMIVVAGSDGLRVISGDTGLPVSGVIPTAGVAGYENGPYVPLYLAINDGGRVSIATTDGSYEWTAAQYDGDVISAIADAQCGAVKGEDAETRLKRCLEAARMR